MNQRKTTVERAYELARSGTVRTISETKRRLRAEGYGDAEAQLYGASLIADLRRLFAASAPRPAPERQGSE